MSPEDLIHVAGSLDDLIHVRHATKIHHPPYKVRAHGSLHDLSLHDLFPLFHTISYNPRTRFLRNIVGFLDFQCL